MYYDYEAPPPPYEKPALPLFDEEALVYVLAAVRHDQTLNTTGLFNYHVKIERHQLEAAGISEDESEKLATENVTKSWVASGYPQFSDLDQFSTGIVKVVKALVGKPVATIWTRDNDSFESWLLSRPWVQYKIAYYITTHHDNTVKWPEVYRHKSPQHVLRIEWLDVQEKDHCGGWLWKGEDAEQVKKGLQQPYPRRSQRLVKRQLMEEREASLLEQRKERLTMMRAQESAEEKEEEVQAKVPPKKKQAVKTKKPSPATATKKKATKPNGAKQEPTKRGKTAKEAGPKKRKTTTKEPASKKRKAAEPAKAKKMKADEQAATKRRKVT